MYKSSHNGGKVTTKKENISVVIQLFSRLGYLKIKLKQSQKTYRFYPPFDIISKNT